jgi:hypothetical protein
MKVAKLLISQDEIEKMFGIKGGMTAIQSVKITPAGEMEIMIVGDDSVQNDFFVKLDKIYYFTTDNIRRVSIRSAKQMNGVEEE